MYDKALAEYEKAYDIMSASIDDWHTLNALIALVGIYYAKNDDEMAENYLAEAEKIAKDIESNEHLADIYRLHYKLSKRRGDNAAALAYHEKATELKDGIINMEDVNRMQSTSLSIEQQRQEQLVQTAQNELSQEKQVRNISIAVFAIILLLVLALFLMTIYTQRVKARSHEALKKLSSMRETFYTNITHEFRTPLTVILGLSEELENGRQKASDVAEKAHTTPTGQSPARPHQPAARHSKNKVGGGKRRLEMRRHHYIHIHDCRYISRLCSQPKHRTDFRR